MITAMNDVLQGLKIDGSCIHAETHRHLAYFDIALERKPAVLRKLENSAKDIALHIKSKTIPIIKLIPELGIVRLQVALKEAKPISFLNLYSGEQIPNMIFPLLLGEDDTGKKLWMDMVNNPHLLIAGGTGSGKSTLLHSLIANALFLTSFRIRNIVVYLADPKRVEFTEYRDLQLNNVIKKVVSTYTETIETLENIERIMDSRYNEMHKFQMRNIEENPNRFSLILCIIDEVADLMMQDKRNGKLQNLIIKIAQKGRAAGIFLILATQRPSVDIITGLIKANFPGRIACKTASRKDSEIILDHPGAETLLGRGDAVLKNMKCDSVRFQAAYITPQEAINTYKTIMEMEKLI
jgi:S-DNA-T family DNA segregation ATPase FtsK/SpoIIIE